MISRRTLVFSNLTLYARVLVSKISNNKSPCETYSSMEFGHWDHFVQQGYTMQQHGASQNVASESLLLKARKRNKCWYRKVLFFF